MNASTRMRVVDLGFLSSLRSINSSTAEKRLETSSIRVIAYSSNIVREVHSVREREINTKNYWK